MNSPEFVQEPLPGMTLKSTTGNDPRVIANSSVVSPNGSPINYQVVESTDPELVARPTLFAEASLITRDSRGILLVSSVLSNSRNRYRTGIYGKSESISEEAIAINSFVSEEQRRKEEHERELEEAISKILGS